MKVAPQEPTRGELEAILEGVPDAVLAQDVAGRIVYANQATLDMLGFASAEELYAATTEEVRERFSYVLPDRSRVPLELLPGRRALRGEQTPAPLLVRYRRGATGEERWARIQARPVAGEDGNVRLAVNVTEDVTEIIQAEQAQRFLAEASRVLASSLDYERTLARVAELAVPEIADWCVVDLASVDGYERVALKHVDPAKLDFAEELTRRYPPDPKLDAGVPRVLRTGQSELYTEIADEQLVQSAVDDEHLRLLRSVGMVSAMIVPMRLRGDVLGTITLVTAESGRRLRPTDAELAEDLAVRAATAVDNARLYSQRSAIAHTLQSSLLPPELPQTERLECAAVFHAAGAGFDVGGDFYDVFSTSAGEWFAVVGDVCGKGAEAAATTALVRYTIRAAAVQRRSPAEILRWLNDAMLRQSVAAGRFCTLAVARLDLGEDGAARVTAASGGHPLPRIVRASGAVARLGESGTLVGVTRRVHLVDGSAELDPGDAVVLFTDGLTEARAPAHVWTPEDVDDALAQAHSGAGDSLRRLVDQVTRAALGDLAPDPRDDVAVLALRVRT